MSRNKKIVLAILCFLIVFFCIGIVVMMLINFVQNITPLVTFIRLSGSPSHSFNPIKPLR